MTNSIDQQLLTRSPAELRAIDARADVALAEAAQLSLASHDALAQSIADAQPRELAAVVIARHKRMWKWRVLALCVFLPLAILGITLFGVTIFTLFTAFIWR